MSLRPELTNLWGLRRRVLKFLIWAQKGSVANIIANSNKYSELRLHREIWVPSVLIWEPGLKWGNRGFWIVLSPSLGTSL